MLQIGTSIRCSKVSIVFGILIMFLVCAYFHEWDFSSPNNLSISTTNGGKVSLVNLLVASVEAAKRGGTMVRKVKEGKDLGVCSIKLLLNFLN